MALSIIYRFCALPVHKAGLHVIVDNGGGLFMRRTGKYYWITMLGYALMTIAAAPGVAFTGALVKSTVGVIVGLCISAFGGGICTFLSFIPSLVSSLKSL